MPYYRRAFLLDDDPASLFLLQDTLQEKQLAEQINCFSRFTELLPAFSCLAKDSEKDYDLPDLLLLDMHMPGRDGLEVLQELLQLPGIGGSKVCTFLLSASYNPEIEEKTKEYPIRGYLVKPLDTEAIEQLILSAKQDECSLKKISTSS